MKIDSIVLENFGLFGSKRFRLDGQPLILIYGANESGKTTTLNGLRQALFGFPRQSAYLTGKTMMAEGAVTLADGRRVKFARQKKNNDGFSAMLDGKVPVSEPEWMELLGGLDLKSYQSLFGFSLDELRNGEKALAHAPIEQALSSSGLGGLDRLQRVQTRIEEFLSQSLKRVGLGGSINAKLAEIESAEKQLEQVLTLPADIESLRHRVSEAQQRVTELADAVCDVRSQLTACQRQQAALPKAIEYRQVQQSLANYTIPQAVDEEFRVRWTVATNRLAGARMELQSASQQLQTLESQLASLPARSDGTSPWHQEVLALGEKAREIPTLRKQLLEDERNLAELDGELEELAGQLGLDRRDTRWKMLKPTATEFSELATAQQTLQALNEQLLQCRLRVDMAEQQLHMHQQAAGPVPHAGAIDDARATTADRPNWDRIVEIENALRALRPLQHASEQALAQLQSERDDRQAARDRESLERQTRILCAAAPNEPVELSMQWRVPATSEVVECHRQYARVLEEVERLDDLCQRTNQECQEARQDLAEQQARSGIKTLAELDGLWCQRDEIIAHWRDELRTPLLASAVTPTEVEERLDRLKKLNGQADAAVRGMLNSVQQLSALAARSCELEQLERSAEQLRTALQTAQQHLDEARQKWHTLWQPFPFLAQVANSPDAAFPTVAQQLMSWLEGYAAWQQRQSNLQSLETRAESCRQRFEQSWQELIQLWPDAAKCSSLADAERRVSALRSEKLKADAEAKWQAERQQNYNEQVLKRASLEQRIAAQRQTCQQAIASLGLPFSWSDVPCTNRLDGLRRCQRLSERLLELSERRRCSQLALDEFVQAVEVMANHLNAGPLTMSAEEHALIWHQQFAHSQWADHRRSELTDAIAAQRATVQRRTAQVDEIEAVLTEMTRSLGAASADQVQIWIGQASAVFQLRAQQSQLKAALEGFACGVPLPEFLKELAELHPRSVAANAATLSARLGSAEASLNGAQQELGGLQRELEYKSQGTAALECEGRLKRLRAELVELSEQWVVHKLAGELLARTIDRFTRDNEPALLSYTRRFFRELTDDRYGMVVHDSRKHGGFAVADNHGNVWQPDKLSTGTREQLYLAIRLAFITHFNQNREPLPVIMDDCFVNFDDTRARIALRTLVHWQESVQTILLSCHWRSVEALAELAPDTPVITIATGETTSARRLVERQDAARQDMAVG